LRLVIADKGDGVESGVDDATSIFDDMDKLRAGLASAGVASTRSTLDDSRRLQRRPRAKGTFAPIPHRAIELYRHIGGAPWAVLIELDRMIFAGRGRNPVIFWSRRLQAAGWGDTPGTRRCANWRRRE
jgi:hypothetical protein